MKAPGRARPAPGAPGRSDQAWGPSRGHLLLALAAVAALPLLWLWASPEADTLPAPPPAPPKAADTAAPVATAVPLPPASPLRPVALVGATPAPAPPPPARDRDGDLTPDLADYLNPGEKPTMAEVIARLHAHGVHSGLGAFQPPGTRPPLIGLAVPEDFVLPAGYVRHHQATDDGQRIEAILMFSPDYRWVDTAGRPVALPPDRLVPPELAPPGLPIRRIVVPAPVDPQK